MDDRPKCKSEILEENVGVSLYNLGLGKLSQDTKSTNHKRKNTNEMDFDFYEIETQNFFI